MYGLNAISAYNGWAISALGISIVFTGLIFLSCVVEQLHKILKIWDDRKLYIQKLRGIKKTYVKEAVDEVETPIDMEEAERNARLLTNVIGGEPFSLPKLIYIAKKRGLKSPYSTIDKLLKAKAISADGNGYFIWSKTKKSY
ncbi:MAG: OadG family protein [Deltaproteobacteria bacterium]|nr:OadG family protein [Deltaproteobacteria bacterium]